MVIGRKRNIIPPDNDVVWQHVYYAGVVSTLF